MLLSELLREDEKSNEEIAEKLGSDILQNWMDMSEKEIFDFLKANIDDTWMSYLKDLSDDELEAAIDSAYYIAHNA